MKILFFALGTAVFVNVTSNCGSTATLPHSIDFSGCTISTHQSVCGTFRAKNANLASLTVYGSKDNPGVAHLTECTLSGLLDVTGKVYAKDSTLDSVKKTGKGELYGVTVTRGFSSTGKTTADNCVFHTFSGTGKLSCKDTQVQETISNTGAVSAHNTKCQMLSVTGKVTAESLSCTSAHITGETEFTKCSVREAAKITGKIRISDSSLQDLNVTGKTTVTNSSIPNMFITGKATLTNLTSTSVETIGKLTATNTTAKTWSAVGTSSFNDCAIDILYVKKSIKIFGIRFSTSQSETPPTITISNTPKNEKNYIVKIVCEDPATKIIYKKGATHAQEIVGTTNIFIE